MRAVNAEIGDMPNLTEAVIPEIMELMKHVVVTETHLVDKRDARSVSFGLNGHDMNVHFIVLTPEEHHKTSPSSPMMTKVWEHLHKNMHTGDYLLTVHLFYSKKSGLFFTELDEANTDYSVVKTTCSIPKELKPLGYEIIDGALVISVQDGGAVVTKYTKLPPH